MYLHIDSLDKYFQVQELLGVQKGIQTKLYHRMLITMKTMKV